MPYPALSRPSGTSSVEKRVSSPTASPPQIASLVTTAVMEVATGARRMSGQDRLAMGPCQLPCGITWGRSDMHVQLICVVIQPKCTEK